MLPSPSPSPWTGRLEKQVEGKRGSQTRSFRFVLLAGLNRGFFKGTVVEGDMGAFLSKTARPVQRASLKRSRRSKRSVCRLISGNEARSSPRGNYRQGELRRCRVGEVNGDAHI